MRVPRLDLAVRCLLEYLELVAGLAISQDLQDALRVCVRQRVVCTL